MIIVQAITLSRAISALVFVSIALLDKYLVISLVLFLYACLTDILDGFLARRLNCRSSTGGLLDLFSDKYLTVISMVYVIARGMPLLPCCVVILREMFLLSVRNIIVKDKYIFPPQRFLGTLIVVPIWGGTVILLLYPCYHQLSWEVLQAYYWGIGLIGLTSLVYKIKNSWKKLIQSFSE